MSFFSWITGAILAAAVLPPLVLLYFLKLRRKRQPISCTLLWQRSIADMQANVPFQRLRRNLLLFLQLLVFLMLILAVAQPRLHSGTGQTGKIIILIDNSASMLTTDVEDAENRLAFAKAEARKRIETLYGGGLFTDSPGETMIIAFSDRAEVMCRFTASQQQLLAAIDRIEPTHAETEIEQAFKLARAYTTNVDPDNPDRTALDPARIEVYSDGRISDLAEQVLRGHEQLVYYPIGTTEVDNVAISSVSVERPYDRPTSIQVFASLANYGMEARECDLQISVDGVVMAIEGVTVAAAELDPVTGILNAGRNTVLFSPFELPRGATIEVANLRADGLEADNIGQLIVAPPKQLKVLLASGTGNLIELALSGQSLADLRRVRTAEELQKMIEDTRLDSFDVVVVDDMPMEQLPEGRYLIFGAPPPLPGLNAFGAGEHQVVIEWRDDHPAMRYVSLDSLYVSKFHKIQPDDDVQVLAEGNSSPLIVAISRGRMQVIYVPFSPLDSNWPFHRGFVNFLVNAVETLGHAGEGIASQGFTPGQALTTRLPAGAQNIELVLPNGEFIPQSPLDPTAWSWGPARLSGVYRLEWLDPSARDDEQEQDRAFAVNLISPSEGNIKILEEISVGTERVEGDSTDDSSYTALWPWAVGICLGLLMLEWWIYHRRTVI